MLYLDFMARGIFEDVQHKPSSFMLGIFPVVIDDKHSPPLARAMLFSATGEGKDSTTLISREDTIALWLPTNIYHVCWDGFVLLTRPTLGIPLFRGACVCSGTLMCSL